MLPLTANKEIYQQESQKKSSCSCWPKKTKKPKHEREFTIHDIEISVNDKAKKILIEEKKK